MTAPNRRIPAGMLHPGDEIAAPIAGRRRLTPLTVEQTLRGTTGARNIVICTCRTPARRRRYVIGLPSAQLVKLLHACSPAVAA